MARSQNKSSQPKSNPKTTKKTVPKITVGKPKTSYPRPVIHAEILIGRLTDTVDELHHLIGEARWEGQKQLIGAQAKVMAAADAISKAKEHLDDSQPSLPGIEE